MKSIALLLLPFVMLAGCSKQPAVEDEPQQTFNDVMKNEVDPKADVVWAVGNAAIDDDSQLDPAKMTDAEWDKLAAGAISLQQSVLKIAHMDPIVIAAPGVKIGDEGIPGGHTAAMVQARFDKEPDKLRAMADALAVHAGDLAQAAKAHDLPRASLLVNQLDGVCESCHLEFWYPDQKELVEKYMNAGT